MIVVNRRLPATGALAAAGCWSCWRHYAPRYWYGKVNGTAVMVYATCVSGANIRYAGEEYDCCYYGAKYVNGNNGRTWRAFYVIIVERRLTITGYRFGWFTQATVYWRMVLLLLH